MSHSAADDVVGTQAINRAESDGESTMVAHRAAVAMREVLMNTRLPKRQPRCLVLHSSDVLKSCPIPSAGTPL